MDFFTLVGLFVVIYFLVYLVALCVLDCDVGLALAELLGKKLTKLQGKVVWVTGASSGIGEAIAFEVAKNGGKLVLSARREDELNRVKATCLELNRKLEDKDILVLPLDITDTDRHETVFNQVIQHFGNLDILINNAGRSQRANWEDIELAVDRQMFELNVFSVVSLSRIAVKYFNGRGKGYIAVTSSVAGVIGAPYSGSYTGSKHALHGYFDCLKMERNGSKLYTTLLCPGPVFSNFLQESFTAKQDEKFGVPVGKKDKRMATDRCAKLCLTAIINKIGEAWIARFPIVPMCYAFIYCPNLTGILLRFVGTQRFQKLRDSKTVVDN